MKIQVQPDRSLWNIPYTQYRCTWGGENILKKEGGHSSLNFKKIRGGILNLNSILMPNVAKILMPNVAKIQMPKVAKILMPNVAKNSNAQWLKPPPPQSPYYGWEISENPNSLSSNFIRNTNSCI